MPRYVIDANFSESLKLESWLGKNPSNIALITTTFSIETYRRRKATGIKRSYGILSRFPKQLKVIRNQEELCRLHVKTKGMTARMMDEEGTADLLDLCRKVEARTDAEIAAAFAPLIRQADEQVEKLQRDSVGLGAEMASQLDQLHERDLYALRTGAPYTSELIRDLLEQVVNTTVAIMQTIPGCYAPNAPADLIRCFPCRLVLCGALALRARARRGDIAKVNPDRIRNDLLDAQYIAIASYFDGLLTEDKGMREVYEEAKVIISLLDGRQRIAPNAPS